MLDSLLDGIKGQVAGALAEKTGLNMGQAEQAVPMAGESIKEGILGAVTKGKTDDLMGMFSSLTGGGGGGGAMGALAGLAGGGGGGGIGGMMKNMVFAGIAQNFVGKLTSKLGIPAGVANSVSGLALPMILNKIKGAASGSSGQVDQAGLLKTLGVDAGSLLGGLGGLAGGGADGAVDAAKDALKGKMGGFGKLLG